MMPSSTLRGAILCVSCLGLLMPESLVLAAQSPARSPAGGQQLRVRNASLTAANSLQGRVTDAQGAGLPHARVTMMQRDRQVVAATTDSHGSFVVANVPAGVYAISSAGSTGTYRLWAARTAPPSASAGILIVADDEVVRGNRLYDWMSEHYLLTYVGIAAAIAVPIAVVGSRSPASP
ncbi:MAG: carboxypeptidase regulatory-like domain-containing protein [Pirellulales bacterium]|nr:carboxypeptidase regulatory-like domain-containing protein [Pirellulales bacterium]